MYLFSSSVLFNIEADLFSIMENRKGLLWDTSLPNCIIVLRVPDSCPRSQKRLQLLRWHLARDASNDLGAVT